MKKHLPSRLEVIELIALSLMLIGLQFAIGSWGWTFIFAMGFVWNWAILNGWTSEQIKTRKYRFSSLRFIHFFHQLFQKPFKKYPRVATIMSVLPAGIFMAVFAELADSLVPWWVAFFGSFGFLLLRYQLNIFIK
jgi:hypothetical protein